jgi:flagellar motor protein MotB
MAGKGGGGAWKVAYADFVTAMMAFFLVMWICGQDQKIRRSVADYFSDPLGNESNSSSNKKPNRTGSVTEHVSSGSIPLEEKVATGQGRKSFSTNRFTSPSTKLLNDWLQLDKDTAKYWHEQAKNQLELAGRAPDLKDGNKTVQQIATEKLSLQLKEEIRSEIPKKSDGVYRNLLEQALRDVNWIELAENMIGQ